jgi:hypothetical protein
MKPPFNSNTPLSSFPYNSRTGKNEFDLYAPSKNYILHGFKPGNSLQASELNEIQENYYKNFTLYNFLMKNWFFLGQDGMVAGNPASPITGPSWIGAVPLHPTNSVTIVGTSIVFKKDWYLVDDFSGIKFWIYNNKEQSISIPSQGYVGMEIERKYITSSDDSDLNDNSNGFSDSSLSPGADRVQLNFKNPGIYSNNTRTDSSLEYRRDILQISQGKISYINNLLKYSIE